MATTAFSPWRPALRMARRDLRRHPVRALLTGLLVMLPILVGTVAALGAHNTRWDGEQAANESMGSADGELVVSRFAAIRPHAALSLWPRPASFTETDGRRVPVRRDAGEVDLAGLLPPGSSITAALRETSVRTAAGGAASALLVDPRADAAAPYVRLLAGRWAAAPDEVTMGRFAADELGLLDRSGAPAPDARLDLADGTTLRVVGLSERRSAYDDSGLALVAPPDGVLGRPGPARHLLVSLPDLSRAETRDLVDTLAAAGVALRPRDAVLHPEAWGLPRDFDRIDVTPLVVGALCLLVGLVEVVLIVGAAFAVAARRHVRDLGLLAANGAGGSDLRRVLLAQGAVLGVAASLAGVTLGSALFLALPRFWERLSGQRLWDRELDWRALVLLLVLGSATSVVAALLPAWSIARLTPVEALNGRFPVRPGESRAHRGAFVLAGSGLVLVAVGGWLTARSFAPRGREESLAVAVAALGLLVAVVGVLWLTPYVVRRVAGLGRLLPLTGRYAFRDAGRHRFRTSAATAALAVTVLGAVLAGFAFRSVARAQDAQDQLPARTAVVSVGATATSTASVRAALDKVLTVRTLDRADYLGRGHRGLVLASGWPEVMVMDRATLARQLGAGHDDVLAAYDAGAAVVRDPRAVGGRELRRTRVDGTLAVRLDQGRPGPAQRWTLPAVVGPRTPLARTGYGVPLGSVVVSPAVADRLGLTAIGTQLLVTTATPVTSEQLDRLQVYGLYLETSDPQRLALERLQFAGLLAAGLICALVVGVAVALAAAESREDVATLAAVGAGPWQRRSFGAVHGLFLGLVGCLLGVAVGGPAGMALTQVDGLPGIDVPWVPVLGTVAVVLVLAPAAGWLVTPSRLRLTRRTG